MRRLIDPVDVGPFQLLAAIYPLEEVRGPRLPDDTIRHLFGCQSCGAYFRLFADTYQGWVSWEQKEMFVH